MGTHPMIIDRNSGPAMTKDLQKLRIEGIYEQRQPAFYMLRVKLPGGVLPVAQAADIAEVAEKYARGSIHLTTRGSIEFHWLRLENLAGIKAMLAAGGLTSRGSCGGAVRGIVCNTSFEPDSPRLQLLARRLHQHFTNRPHFEGLPKKFKIGIVDGYQKGIHLIQDVGLVPAGSAGEPDAYDVWVAGGLGREPAPGFLLQAGVPERRLIPLVEGIISGYRDHAPAGKRLKHLVREIGRTGFVELLGKQQGGELTLPLPDEHEKTCAMVIPEFHAPSLEAAVFAGELTAAALRSLAVIAAEHADGFLVLNRDQNVSFPIGNRPDRERAAAALAQAGFLGHPREERVRFRVCPGSHECRFGLVPTRDMARELLAEMGREATTLTWAIAGCPNSCSQPQLASVGVIATRMVQEQQDERQPRFDLYRRNSQGFGTRVGTGLTLQALREAVRALR